MSLLDSAFSFQILFGLHVLSIVYTIYHDEKASHCFEIEHCAMMRTVSLEGSVLSLMLLGA